MIVRNIAVIDFTGLGMTNTMTSRGVMDTTIFALNIIMWVAHHCVASFVHSIMSLLRLFVSCVLLFLTMLVKLA